MQVKLKWRQYLAKITYCYHYGLKIHYSLLVQRILLVLDLNHQEGGKKDVEDLRNKHSEVPCTEDPSVNQAKDANVNSTNNINTVSPTDNVAGIIDNVVDENIVYGCADDLNMPDLEEIGKFSNAENDDSGADMNNFNTYFQVSHVPTTRIHKDHPFNQVIGDLQSTTQTRQMTKNLKEYGLYGVSDGCQECFLYSKIEKEVYVCQPPGFEDLDFPDRVYKVEKALYLRWPPRVTLGRLLPHARGLGFKPRRGGFPSGAKKEWGLSPKAKVRVFHTAQLDVTCKKQTVVANSTIKAEYVAAPSCCVKNPVFHSKTKHIEIRHHFIRDSNEKKLIQMINIYTDKNVPDLLAKAFDNGKAAKEKIGTSSGGGPRRQDTMGDTIGQTRDEDIFGVNDQDDTSIFNADKDLQGEEVVVEKEVDGKDVSVVEEVNAASIATSVTTTTITAVITFTISLDEITLAKALIEIKTSRSKEKGIVMQEPSETPTPTLTVSSQQPLKVQDKGKGIMVEEPLKIKKKYQILFDAEEDIQAKVDVDYQLAERLQAEEQEKLIDAEKAKLFIEFMKKRRKFFAVKTTKEKRNKPHTKAQQRSIMRTYLKNMDGWKPRALKNKSFAKIKELFDKAMKRINNFIDFRTELVEECTKKDKADTIQESSLKRAGDELDQEKSKK
nr:hypothetical protein [Tanacetum cinerariifolium]